MKAKDRERLLGDPEFMAELRQWALAGSIVSDEELLDRCGDTFGAAGIEYRLERKRFWTSVRESELGRAVEWIIGLPLRTTRHKRH